MFTAQIIHVQTFAAPQFTFLTISQTVKRQTDDVSAVQWPAVFCQAGGDMRVVMQNVNHPYSVAVGLNMADVGGMRIARDDRRRTGKEMLKMFLRLLLLQGNITMRQRTKMCAEHCLTVAHQAKGIFEIATLRE